MNEQLIYRGKTKDVYRRPDGKLKFVFKDDATGYVVDKGKPTEKIVFDSGYDEVVGKIPGKGVISCQFTKFFLELFEENGIPTHYIESPPHSNVMIVKEAKLLGASNTAKGFDGSADIYGIECVFRHEVYGSFWRRYPCMRPGDRLNAPVEMYAKGRAGEPDILMTEDVIVELGLMTPEEVAQTKLRVKDIARIMYNEFEKRDFHLIDGKMELGRSLINGKIIVIDDFSPDTFRVCRGYTSDKYGNCIIAKECITTRLDEKGRKIIAKNILTADQEGLKQLAEALRFKI